MNGWSRSPLLRQRIDAGREQGPVIHLVTNIDDAVITGLLAMISQLSEAQKEFVLARDADRARAFRIAQLLVVSEALGNADLTPGCVDIALDAQGRPRLLDSGHEISVSHTRDALAVAVDSARVGIDIETLRPRDIGVMRKLFSAAEIDEVGCDTSFTHAWVRKEAYAKWTGMGLGEYLADGRYDTRVESFESRGLYIGVAGGSGSPVLVEYKGVAVQDG